MPPKTVSSHLLDEFSYNVPFNVKSLKRLRREYSEHVICPDHVVRVFTPYANEWEHGYVVYEGKSVSGTVEKIGYWLFFEQVLEFGRTIPERDEAAKFREICLEIAPKCVTQ